MQLESNGFMIEPNNAALWLVVCKGEHIDPVFEQGWRQLLHFRVVPNRRIEPEPIH